MACIEDEQVRHRRELGQVAAEVVVADVVEGRVRSGRDRPGELVVGDVEHDDPQLARIGN